ncbi:SDR family oxidoreductase [Actinophytocola oryzae]|uniref:NADP-dependent 3-hydroxy acid dehydrogenase YdfG n=1 Tax=Actinophytocola oryzae TaxID=502181 RepID=A0A4V3FR04_9PSEU|nr:SDR family oxidoreductase [Actinophytocola oryzae]TDV41731.1 NADP-dependent 3-hydroxy acid dehydrogenase YdfG [Actinophytocola oryzae]
MATILVTGASSGFGLLTANALHEAGHTVYAGMRHADTRPEAAEARRAGLRPVDLDVTSDESVDALDLPDLDVLVHNAGHMVTGPAEAFTPEQYAALYDTNVLGAQRVNRKLLPAMRARGDGLVVWMGSSSTRGGTPPYLAPYFAAKAAFDALAASYALELARFGIETSIIVPGAFTSGTNHFAHSGHPSDTAVADVYETRYPGLMDQAGAALATLMPEDADAAEVARAIVRVVAAPKGTRPFRVHVDPSDDGATVVNAVADRIRAEFLHRIGLADLLHPVA